MAMLQYVVEPRYKELGMGFFFFGTAVACMASSAVVGSMIQTAKD